MSQDPEYLPPATEHLSTRDQLRVAEAAAKGKLPKEKHLRAITGQVVAEKLTLLDATADRVLLELCRVAFASPTKLFHTDGSVKRIEELDEDTARALSSIEFEETDEGTIRRKYRLADKLKALELLGKYHKLFTERLEVQGVDELVARLEQARQRERELTA